MPGFSINRGEQTFEVILHDGTVKTYQCLFDNDGPGYHYADCHDGLPLLCWPHHDLANQIKVAEKKVREAQDHLLKLKAFRSSVNLRLTAEQLRGKLST